tara:strand:- start:240 stop:1148 length:909 start_codon:yes stop_codon:yes gene_type:complete
MKFLLSKIILIYCICPISLSADAFSNSIGGASVAYNGDINGDKYNPALVTFDQTLLSLSNSFLPLDRYIISGFASKSISSRASISMYYSENGTNDIQGYDSMNNFSNIIESKEQMGALSFSSKISNLFSIGISIKGYRSNIDNQIGSGIGFDFGLFYLKKKYGIGLLVSDCFAKYTWRINSSSDMVSSYDEKLSNNIVFGGHYTFKKLTYLAQYDISSQFDYGIDDCLRIGIIWDLSDILNIRFGLSSINKFKYNERVLKISNFTPSCGTTFKYKSILLATSFSYGQRSEGISSSITIGLVK